MHNILDLSIMQISSLIKNKEVSPVQITDKLLSEIAEVNKINNAYITVCTESAVNEAKKAEKEILNGNYRGPLHGIPISIKDNVSVKNTRCTSGSIIYKDYISQNDAPVVEYLRSNGAIIIGKTNLDEFANHVVGNNKNYGTIRNPINHEYTPGGSSGGSAVSVAAKLSYGSIGTDTSGSVRIPATCCGIVGLKPSYNLIPTIGVHSLSWSLDHVGILSRDCNDLSLLLDATVPGSEQGFLHLDKSIKINELTIGIPENYFFESIDKTIETKIREIINLFVGHGAKVKNIKLQNLTKVLEAQEIIIAVEAAYNHKFNLQQFEDKYEKDNFDFFKYGLTISESQYYDAQAIKHKVIREFQNIFSEIDIFLTPTLPITIPKHYTEKVTWGEYEEEILKTLSRYTGPFNVTGLPALSIPVGSSPNNLPISLQIVGNMYSEKQLLSVGDWIMEKVR